MGDPVLVDGTEYDASPDVPWIGVLDDMADAVDGLEPAVVPAMNALRDYVHYDQHLVYNPGDGAYSSFEGE